MHCNQSFCTNGFSTGPYYGYSVHNPHIQLPGLHPEIVGEGEVTSISLPDGSFQLFFTPTIKWWTPPPVNTGPYYTNFNANPNSLNIRPNSGTWFVRSIINPLPSLCLPSCRYETSGPAYTSEYNVNSMNGFQLKFHNDKCTSTTDMHYFYPALCQYEFSLSLPKRGCVAMQVDIPPVSPYHEVERSKPCHCNSKSCRDMPKPASDMSIGKSKTKSKHVICECGAFSTKPHSIKSESSQNIPLKLLPNDAKRKRIKLEKKTQKKCSANKAVTTYNEKASGGDPNNNAETQSCCERGTTLTTAKDFMRNQDKLETWYLNNTSSTETQSTKDTKGEYESCCCSSNCSCYSSYTDGKGNK